MLTVLCSLLFGLLVSLLLWWTDAASSGWMLFWALLAAAVAHVIAGLILRRKVKAAMELVQNVLMVGQKRLQQKVNQWQTRPPGSIKQAQAEIEREQRQNVEQALAQTGGLEKLARWTLMLDRQIATLRMQLYYQIREYKKVDELLPRCLFLDPVSAAMKIARLHMRQEAAAVDAAYRKHTRRLRYGQGALLYALYAWILIQRQDVAGAHKVLVKACTRLEHEVLKVNREHLANNRLTQFSNAGLGDEWYALGLEQPRVKYQRQRPGDRPF